MDTATSIPKAKAPGLHFIKRLLLYLGPALIVSTAYMDPGNYGTDLAAGASFRYDLIWSVWLASGMAMVLQYLSGKLGIATGRSLPELIRGSLSRNAFVVPYWLAAEIAAAATDLAEFLGTVFALYLLFNVPLLYAAIFGAFDVVLLLAFSSRRFRIIEQFFMIFVSVIGFGFLYESVVIKASLSDILYHTVTPVLQGPEVLLVVGIIGATVMPHALFVHSWLTRNKLKSNSIDEKRELRKLHLAENALLLGIAAVINVSILVVSTTLYPNPSIDIATAYSQFALKFGSLFAVVFVLTLLASGLTSSTTGTIAGQAIMEGLVGQKVGPWTRRIVTRFVNVVPTTIAILLGLDPLRLLVYSQVALSLLIPLPMVPLIYYTAKRKFMGEFVNRKFTTILAILCAVVIIVFNAYLLLTIA